MVQNSAHILFASSADVSLDTIKKFNQWSLGNTVAVHRDTYRVLDEPLPCMGSPMLLCLVANGAALRGGQYHRRARNLW